MSEIEPGEPPAPTPTPTPATAPFDTCYRHDDRRAGVRCQRCERPICPSCMVQASVGFQCPECVRGGGTRVIRAGQLVTRPLVTQAIIAINVVVFLVQLSEGGSLGRAGRLIDDYALFGPAVEDGEWWRLVTAGFLHVGIMHVAFNMLILYRLGEMLEPALGRIRFSVLYLASLLAGSAGALLLSPDTNTVGASGAVFGLLGAAVVGYRRRGVDPLQTDIGSLLVINVILTFVIPRISIGGHLGGLVGGALVGWLLLETKDRFRRRT
jgi:membrane associated rhomboid family serine protease